MLSNSAAIFSEERPCRHRLGKDGGPTLAIDWADGGFWVATRVVPTRVTRPPRLKKKVIPRRLIVFSAPHIHDGPSLSLRERHISEAIRFSPLPTRGHMGKPISRKSVAPVGVRHPGQGEKKPTFSRVQ